LSMEGIAPPPLRNVFSRKCITSVFVLTLDTSLVTL
jgi:hypothetical protein